MTDPFAPVPRPSPQEPRSAPAAAEALLPQESLPPVAPDTPMFPAVLSAGPAAAPAAAPTLPPALVTAPPAAVAPGSPSPRLRIVLRTLLAAHLLLILALGSTLTVGWNYKLLLAFSGLRTIGLAMIIVAGAGATLSFGGVMLCLDRLLDLSPPLHWSWRLLIDPAKRLLLVAQLATTAAVLLAIVILALHRAIPILL